MIEQLFTIFEICIKLFTERMLTPLLNIIYQRRLLSSKDAEVTISINVSPAGQRLLAASASKPPPIKKSVTFEGVQIRTYESILGESIIRS